MLILGTNMHVHFFSVQEMTEYKKRCKGIVPTNVVQAPLPTALKEEDDDDEDDEEN